MAVQSSAATGESNLDRRRIKLQDTKSAAAESASGIVAIEKKLRRNDDQVRDQEAALAAALDGVAELKKSLKTSAKDRTKLLADRKSARRVVEKAQERLERAEGKYDQAVLDDIVRREKDNDLSAHAPTPIRATGSAATNGAGATAATRSANSATRASGAAPHTPKSATTTTPRGRSARTAGAADTTPTAQK